jgi:predicted DNA binding CopG/RHH family protein
MAGSGRSDLAFDRDDANISHLARHRIEPAEAEQLFRNNPNMLAQGSGRKELLPVTIRLAHDDVEAARRLAGDQGIGYQAYIRLVPHKALQKEAARAARGR